jgi:hypothetical protein
VLAVGVKPGVVHESSPWEEIFAPFSHTNQGDLDKGRALTRAPLEKRPDQGQAHYNAAWFDFRYGDREAGIASLEHAYQLAPEQVTEAAADDPALDSVRADPRVLAIAETTEPARPYAGP